jgi:hypothetical protein
VHSPIGKSPELFGIRLRTPKHQGFASNEVPFDDPTGTDHDMLGIGLRKALYNYMHGLGLDDDVRAWFPAAKGRKRTIPATTVPSDLIRRALAR